MKSNKNLNIGVITSPLGDANKTCVSNLVNILHPLSNDIYFITGNGGCDLFKENKKIHTYLSFRLFKWHSPIFYFLLL